MGRQTSRSTKSVSRSQTVAIPVPGGPQIGLRPLEPETSRVVIIHDEHRVARGAGCLVSNTQLLTCQHVLALILGEGQTAVGADVRVTLVGVTGELSTVAKVVKLATMANANDWPRDLALLELPREVSVRLAIQPIEFATPLRHSGKPFSVMGFPVGNDLGLHASGVLRATDRHGLIQMDGSTVIAVAPGYSGAPVWCEELRAFVGLIVASEDERGLAWCIPSRILCKFCPGLLVKFRIPPRDRPVINDRETDDPNTLLFGQVSDDGRRRLSARILRGGEDNIVELRYECLRASEAPRGGYVTFITYPDFGREEEDAYELFSPVQDGIAENTIYPGGCFTVAAVGDAGDTVLTLDLCQVKGGRKSFYQ